MSILILLSTILVGHIALSDESTVIDNESFDRLLNMYPLDEVVHIGPYKFENLEVNAGKLHIYSIKRAGDAIITKSSDRGEYVVDLHLRPRYSVADFSSIKINGDQMDGDFRINNGYIHLTYTVNEKNCEVHADSMEFETMTNVTLTTPRDEYSGRDFSFTFQNMFRPEINKVLVNYYSKLEKTLGFICRFM